MIDRPGVAAAPYVQPAGKGLGFYTGDDGYLYVDNLRIDDIRAEVLAMLPVQLGRRLAVSAR